MVEPTYIAEIIKAKAKQISQLKHEIDELAKAHFPEFHFLDHKVSTFWACPESPIGMCIFRLGDYGSIEECVFCGLYEERK